MQLALKSLLNPLIRILGKAFRNSEPSARFELIILLLYRTRILPLRFEVTNQSGNLALHYTLKRKPYFGALNRAQTDSLYIGKISAKGICPPSSGVAVDLNTMCSIPAYMAQLADSEDCLMETEIDFQQADFVG